jgi:hypothetical protein
VWLLAKSFLFFTALSFANSCGINVVGEATLPTAPQGCWERIFAF